jgi:hypothetical protein
LSATKLQLVRGGVRDAGGQTARYGCRRGGAARQAGAVLVALAASSPMQLRFSQREINTLQISAGRRDNLLGPGQTWKSAYWCGSAAARLLSAAGRHSLLSRGCTARGKLHTCARGPKCQRSAVCNRHFTHMGHCMLVNRRPPSIKGSRALAGPPQWACCWNGPAPAGV